MREVDDHLSKWMYIVFFVITINVLLLYKIKYVTFALLLFVMPVTLLWNPVIVAPSHVGVNLPKQLRAMPENLNHDGRFLIISDNFEVPNLFMASGLKAMNATSHYVDSYMYDNFYSKLENPEQYNRFNHLNVSIDNLKPDMGISLGGTDWIKMRLNALHFDFSLLPVDYLAVSGSPFIKDLNSNTKLDFIDNVGDFYFYRVKSGL